MKKVILTLAAFSIAAIVAQSCKKAADCIALVQSVSNAAAKFDADSISAANCTEYKTSLQNWLNSSCSGTDATTKASFQAELDSLHCP
jgi:hypothetical protein